MLRIRKVALRGLVGRRAGEDFWVEITDRDDLGVDLSAPQRNKNGQRSGPTDDARRGGERQRKAPCRGAFGVLGDVAPARTPAHRGPHRKRAGTPTPAAPAGRGPAGTPRT